MNNLTQQELQLYKIIRNYLSHSSFLPSYRTMMSELNYKSPRSINLLINSLVEKKFLIKNDKDQISLGQDFQFESLETEFIEVPIVGRVACGVPNFAEENNEGRILISTTIAKPPYKYFILRTFGDSMETKGITENMLVLIRQQNSAKNGDIVCAMIENECTLKEFFKTGEFIVLKPHSNNPLHKPILVTNNFKILGIMIHILPPLLE